MASSEFVAKGVVEGTKGVKGKRVVVNVKSQNANLGELLRFVSKAAQPPAYGNLVIDTAFDLPQGKEPVLTRVQLEGSVRAERVTFTNDAVQDKIDELSRRGQGKPTDASIDEVASQLSSKFALKNGVFTYQTLTFNVQGADVQLNGTHSLRSKSLNLAGEVKLNATVSQTMTGLQELALETLRSVVQKERGRHPAGHPRRKGRRTSRRSASKSVRRCEAMTLARLSGALASRPSCTTNSPALSPRSSSFTARYNSPSFGIGTLA